MKAPLLLTYSAPKYYAIAANYTAKQGIHSCVLLGGEKLITQDAADAIF